MTPLRGLELGVRVRLLASLRFARARGYAPSLADDAPSGLGNNCCISPFFCLFSASIFWTWVAMRSSREVRVAAIFCCSANDGGNGIDRKLI